jgi:hypothetical protein
MPVLQVRLANSRSLTRKRRGFGMTNSTFSAGATRTTVTDSSEANATAPASESGRYKDDRQALVVGR